MDLSERSACQADIGESRIRQGESLKIALLRWVPMKTLGGPLWPGLDITRRLGSNGLAMPPN
jgi:hypothetical protein